MKTASWMRRRVLILAIVAIGVAAIGGTALAGHVTGAVKSYTGCLVPKDGVIIKVKEGTSPASACTGGSTQVHLSGGDITKISVSGGLTLPNGGDNGEVTIALDPKYSLPQTCSNAQVAKWQGSTTSWVCAADDDTTYSAGTGLDLSSGNAFSIEPAYRVPGKACATAGHFARGFDSGGAIQCAAPGAAAGIEVWSKVRPAVGAGTVIVLPKGEGVDVIEMPLPAGTFLVTAVTPVSDRNSDEEVSVTCWLRDGAFGDLPVHAGWVDIGEESGGLGPTGAVMVHGLLTLASADTVRFTCRSSFGDSEPDQAEGATMTAVKVGTVHTP